MNIAFTQDLIAYCKHTYHAHTVIVYGSFVTGGFTPDSDVDAVCFCEGSPSRHDHSKLKGQVLDLWIYDSAKLDDPDSFLHIREGAAILDEHGKGHDLLAKVQKRYDAGPEPISEDEAQFLKGWLNKMLQRAIRGDAEGNFRFHWMLVDSLEIYFKLKRRWYLGPKKSLAWLESNDPYAYELFVRALDRNSGDEDAKRLIAYLTLKIE